MGAMTTMMVAGMATQAASAGMSYHQMQKQRKLQLQAQEQAKKSISEARKRLDVNFYDALSVIKEPYELQREAMLSSGAQSIEAARESQRGVAGTAGRVQMANIEGNNQIRTAMGNEMQNLERLSATEESRLRDAKAQLDLEEVAGAQLAAKNAQELEWRSQQNMLNSVSRMANTGINLGRHLDEGFADPFSVAPQTQPQFDMSSQLPSSYDGKMLDPMYQNMSMNDIVLQMQNTGQLSPNMNEINYTEVFNLLYR